MKTFTRIMTQAKSFIVVSFFFMIIVFCNSDQSGSEETIISGTPVQIIQPQVLNFTEFIDLNANTIFLKKEIVRATFQGFIEKTYKNIGDQVKTGDLLFSIKTKESMADDGLHINLGNETFQGSINLRAKSEGIVTKLNYNTGDFVSDGEEIAIISNPSSLCITLNVPYQYVSRLNYNLRCKIFLPNGQELGAIIQKVIPSVDPVSQTQTFLLGLENNKNLPENLNMSARLPLQTINNAIVLPRSAVLSDEIQENFWVMQVINDSTAVRVDVKKGIENDSLIQIVYPVLNPNDEVISEGAYGLPDTAKVIISR